MNILKIGSWNINRLNAMKFEDVGFRSIVNKFDIVGLVESWTHRESRIDLPGYENIHIASTKRKKKGRRSGGIIL